MGIPIIEKNCKKSPGILHIFRDSELIYNSVPYVLRLSCCICRIASRLFNMDTPLQISF